MNRVLLGVLALCVSPAWAQVVIVTDTTIDSSNASAFMDQDIIIRGAVVTLNVPLTVRSLVLARSASNAPAVLTHEAGLAGGIRLDVTTDMYVQGAEGTLVASRVNLDERGHAGYQGPGAGAFNTDGHEYGGGASHAGRGAPSFRGDGSGPCYGDIFLPRELGSGGGGLSGGAGGGAIHLRVKGSLVIGGGITANGGDGPPRFGGGSGGSVLIEAGSIEHTGSITALGGLGIPVDSWDFWYGAGGGSGGGGRIAIYTDAGTLSGNITACSAPTYPPGKFAPSTGGAGTVFTRIGEAPPHLLIANCRAGLGRTEIIGGVLGTSANVEVQSFARLATAPQTPLKIRTTGSFYLAAQTFIFAGGFNREKGPGAGVTSTDPRRGTGGSHGGRGGASHDGTHAPPPCGSRRYPRLVGSGGGGPFGGSGGGAVEIVAGNSIDLFGQVHVNGVGGAEPGSGGVGDGGRPGGGGGAGGSVLLVAPRVSVQALISANGGRGARSHIYIPNGSGAGGGGRIAVFARQRDILAGSLRADRELSWGGFPQSPDPIFRTPHYSEVGTIFIGASLADYDGNDQVDFFDYLDFIQDFANEHPDADFNGDGSVDHLDYLDFLAAFLDG